MLKQWMQEQTDWRITLCLEEEALSVRTLGAGREIGVGLGKRPELTAEMVRRAAAKAVKVVRPLGARSALLDASAVTEALGADGLAALAQGAGLALYRRESWKKQEEKPFTLYVAGTGQGDMDAVLAETTPLVEAVCFVRDLVNCPANLLPPMELARRTTAAAAAVGVETEILDENAVEALGMGAFLTVGRSGGHAPCLIVLRYRGGKPGDAPIALVGKGVCADTGGYCLKPARALLTMKGDMAGGAAACGAVMALAANRVPVNAVAVIPAVENRISPESYLPGDVITSMSGLTIEIGDSDAEGRLILADAVTYAVRRENAAMVVDIATLTGAMARTLGPVATGYLCSDEALSARLQDAASRSGEQFWRFPAFPEYRRMIDSPIADLRNISDNCGAICAGLFVGAFTEGKPWLHLDIAGTADTDHPVREYQVKGATGVAVTTLYELCKGLAE